MTAHIAKEERHHLQSDHVVQIDCQSKDADADKEDGVADEDSKSEIACHGLFPV